MMANPDQEPRAANGLLAGCGVTINTHLYDGFVGSEALNLTSREFDLLHLLLNESYRVTSREEIRRRIWESQSSSERVVDTYVCRVRKKLKNAGHPGIGVVHRRGYRLLGAAE